MKSSGEDKELTSYMDQMDEELARTSIGESFEKVSGWVGEARELRQGRRARAGDILRARSALVPIIPLSRFSLVAQAGSDPPAFLHN